MAKYSKKLMGKEIGDAEVYAAPHTMKGKTMDEKMTKAAVTKPGNGMDKMNISVGNVGKRNYAPEKTDGIKIRGTGAATKGLKARGPMA
jgi:hypothetical protein